MAFESVRLPVNFVPATRIIMKTAPLPENELQRLSELYEYNLLDTLAEKDYDDITQIAAEICDVPISLISLIDHNRQWFKSRVGVELNETSRDVSFCAHAILKPNEIFVVEDSSKDDRFFDNPFVTGAPNVGFYAGVPLVTESGNALGSLCVIDTKPNHLTRDQEYTLKALARQVVAYLEIRKKTRQLALQKASLERLSEDLKRFAYTAAHDIKSPCVSLAMSAEYLLDNYAQSLDIDAREMLDMMKDTSQRAINMVDGILSHTLVLNKGDETKQKFTFEQLMLDIRPMLNMPSAFAFNVVNKDMQLFTSHFLLTQVFVNLCSNAIKYNDKEDGEITVEAGEKDNRYCFFVKDNGRGINEIDHSRIFDLFSTLGTTDRFSKRGTGIGLSTVKNIVERMGGNILVHSQPGEGSVFEFTINK